MSKSMDCLIFIYYSTKSAFHAIIYFAATLFSFNYYNACKVSLMPIWTYWYFDMYKKVRVLPL